MTDLKKRLRPMEQVDAPDLWEDIERRRPAQQSEGQESGLRRAGTIVLAFVVAASAFAFAVSRLGGEGSRGVGGGETMTRYRFDAPPQAIAAGEGAAWVHVGAGDVGGPSGIWRIDAASGERQRIDVPGGDWPSVGGGSAWLLCNSAACAGHAVVQIDPASGSVLRTIDLPERGGQIAGVEGGVWITTEAGLSFVGGDGRVARSFPGQNYNFVGSDGTSLWVSRSRGLSKIDPETGERLADVSFSDVCTMEVAAGTVWVASCDAGLHAGGDSDELMGVDAASGQVLFREPIPDNGQMRFLDGVLWLAERSADGPIRIVGLDPRTGAPTGNAVTVARDPSHFAISGFWGPHVFFAVGEGSLWVTDFGAAEVIRISGPFAQGTGDPDPEPLTTTTGPTPTNVSTASVPDVVGLPPYEAEQSIVGVNLVVDVLRGDPSTAGTAVVEQDPPAGTEVDTGFPVLITLSAPGEGSKEAVAIDGVPYPVCRPVTIDGDFGAGLDRAWVFEEERVPGAGCEGSEGFQRLAVGSGDHVQLLSGRITDIFNDRAYKVWPYATPDLDGDGVDEIALAKGEAPGSRLLWFVKIAGSDLMPVVRECSASCDPTWNPIIGTVGHANGTITQGGLYCEPHAGGGPTLVEWESGVDDPLSISESRWTLHDQTVQSVSRRTYSVTGSELYPPSGLDELCGSPVSLPGVPVL